MPRSDSSSRKNPPQPRSPSRSGLADRGTVPSLPGIITGLLLAVFAAGAVEADPKPRPTPTMGEMRFPRPDGARPATRLRGAPAGPTSLGPGHGVLLEPLPSGEALLVINTNDEGGTRWFLLGGSISENRQLGADLTAMHQVCGLLPSPDGKYLAALSVAEGAVILEVVDLPTLVKTGKFVVRRTVNPFPGLVGAGSWQDGRFVFESNLPLHLPLGSGTWPTCLLLPDHERFALDPAAGTIAAVNLDEGRLARLYARGLRSHEPGGRIEAAHALLALRSRLAVPTLARALEREKDPSVAKALREALDGVASSPLPAAGQ